jgi:hypothetical protein
VFSGTKDLDEYFKTCLTCKLKEAQTAKEATTNVEPTQELVLESSGETSVGVEAQIISEGT